MGFARPSWGDGCAARVQHQSVGTAGAAANSGYVNHFGLLAGLEKRYGLPCLGQACSSSNGVLPLP